MHGFLSLAFLLSTGTAPDHENPAPRMEAHLWLASAAKRDGKIFVQIAEPQERGGSDGRGGFPPGVRTLPASTITVWSNLREVSVGKGQAFQANGKKMEPEALLSRLAKPSGVAVFVRTKPDDSTAPDPFYLNLLREHTIVLIVNQKDLYPQEP